MMKQPPNVQCYDCRKPMVETFRDEDSFYQLPIIKMNCPDKCAGQPELTLKDMGPFWENVTNPFWDDITKENK